MGQADPPHTEEGGGEQKKKKKKMRCQRFPGRTPTATTTPTSIQQRHPQNAQVSSPTPLVWGGIQREKTSGTGCNAVAPVPMADNQTHRRVQTRHWLLLVQSHGRHHTRALMAPCSLGAFQTPPPHQPHTNTHWDVCTNRQRPQGNPGRSALVIRSTTFCVHSLTHLQNCIAQWPS